MIKNKGFETLVNGGNRTRHHPVHHRPKIYSLYIYGLNSKQKTLYSCLFVYVSLFHIFDLFTEQTMDRRWNKYCIVPKCENTSVRTPDSVFWQKYENYGAGK